MDIIKKADEIISGIDAGIALTTEETERIGNTFRGTIL